MVEANSRVDIESAVGWWKSERGRRAQAYQQGGDRRSWIGTGRIERRNHQLFDPLCGCAHVHQRGIQRRGARRSRNARGFSNRHIDAVVAWPRAARARLGNRNKNARAPDPLPPRHELRTQQRSAAEHAPAAHGHRQTEKRRDAIVAPAILRAGGDPQHGADEQRTPTAIDDITARIDERFERAGEQARDGIGEVLRDPETGEHGGARMERGRGTTIQPEPTDSIPMTTWGLAEGRREPTERGRQRVLRREGRGRREQPGQQDQQGLSPDACMLPLGKRNG